MEARAILRYARISPRKVSIVMDLIRNKPLDEALAILQYTPKAACEPLLKLVKSAAANAENNFNMDKNNLYVAECYVCPGPTLKRMMPRAQAITTLLWPMCRTAARCSTKASITCRNRPSWPTLTRACRTTRHRCRPRSHMKLLLE